MPIDHKTTERRGSGGAAASTRAGPAQARRAPTPARSYVTINWHKGKRVEVVNRSAEPGLDCVAVGRERAAQRYPMLGQAPSRGAAVSDHDPRADGLNPPPALTRNVPREPTIPIDLPNEAADVADRALHLDDQECPPPGMPRYEIERAALTEDRERHLGLDDPLGKL